jgi:hypothetical protein
MPGDTNIQLPDYGGQIRAAAAVAAVIGRIRGAAEFGPRHGDDARQAARHAAEALIARLTAGDTGDE